MLLIVYLQINHRERKYNKKKNVPIVFTLKLHFPETSIYVSPHWFVYLMFNAYAGIISYILRGVSSHRPGESAGRLSILPLEVWRLSGVNTSSPWFPPRWDDIAHSSQRALVPLPPERRRYVLVSGVKDTPTLVQAMFSSSILYI